MSGIDRHQAFAALVLLVTALFVASGYAPAARWRRPLRAAAIGFFVLAVIAALVEIVRWLAAPDG
jgi:asparagine N-glycosylation enzyme membrane subunit Stt3